MTQPHKRDTDIVIISALRSPILKAAKNVSYSDDSILTQVLHESLVRLNVRNANMEILLGNVCMPQGGVIEARIAALRNQIPVETPVMTINRQCASSLEAIKVAAHKLEAKDCDVMIVGGFEMMSRYGLRNEFCVDNMNVHVSKENMLNLHAKNCTLSMGITSENLAEKFNLSRNEIDEYAYDTHDRAYQAKRQNKYEEIVPIVIDNTMITHDTGIREPNYEKLISLKPVFKVNGVSTAGNSSQISDGASIVIMTTRKYAEDNGYPVLCKYVDCVTVGVEPSIMGYGPVPAIRKLLGKNKLSTDDVEYFEVNEAFGSQALCCMKELKLARNRFNIWGGAIAIGHPVGATGSRLVATMNSIFKSNDAVGYGVVSLCAATGMGTAGLFYFE